MWISPGTISNASVPRSEPVSSGVDAHAATIIEHARTTVRRLNDFRLLLDLADEGLNALGAIIGRVNPCLAELQFGLVRLLRPLQLGWRFRDRFFDQIRAEDDDEIVALRDCDFKMGRHS